MALIRQILIVAIFLILAIPTSASEKEYILPEPDIRPENTSEPCLSGTITRVEKGKITVSGINHNGKDESIEIVIKGSIFIVYGGYVSPTQLKEGIKLKVWFMGSSCDQPFKPISSARIMVASRRPGDDWP